MCLAIYMHFLIYTLCEFFERKIIFSSFIKNQEIHEIK